MLQVFRNSAKGNVGKIIVGLIVITFVSFGATSIVSVVGNSAPATVNGDDISQAEYQRATEISRMDLARQYGPEIANQLAGSSGFAESVLNSLINQLLQEQLTSNLKFEVSDDQVLKALGQAAEFQVDGKFDKATYERVLASMGYDHSSYLAEQTMQSALNQMRAGIFDSAFVVDKSVAKYAQLTSQKRKVSYREFSVADYLQGAEVTKEELEAYYAENQSGFVSPEQVKVEYIRITLDDLAKQVEVTEAQIESAYQSYLVEQNSKTVREISHILFAEGDDLNAQAEAAMARLANGETFAELASELSDDPGSSDFGGALGELIPDIYADEFYNAAVQLSEAGEVSQPVETEFGVHLILLDSLDMPEIESLDIIRAELAQQIKVRTASEDMVMQKEELANVAVGSDNLSEVAELFNVSVQESDWLSRGSQAGLLSGTGVSDAVFSDRVLFDEMISDTITLDNDDLMVVKKSDYKAESIKEFEEVEAEIQTIVSLDKANELMLADIESIIESTTEINDDWTDPVDVERVETSIISANIVNKVFELASPEAGEITLGQLQSDDISYAVALLEVIDGDASEEQVALVERYSLEEAGPWQYQLLFNHVRSDAKIKTR